MIAEHASHTLSCQTAITATSTKPSPAKHQRGFTLMEVLVALVILAIALTGVIVALGNAARFDAKIRDNQAAQWVAQNIASGLKLHLLAPNYSEEDKRSIDMMHESWIAKIKIIQHGVNIDQARIRIYHPDSQGNATGHPLANIRSSYLHPPDDSGHGAV